MRHFDIAPTSQHQKGFRVKVGIDQALGCLLASGIQGNYQNVAMLSQAFNIIQSNIFVKLSKVLWVILAGVDFSNGPMPLAAHAEVVGLPLAPLSKLIVAELANHLKGSEVQKCW